MKYIKIGNDRIQGCLNTVLPTLLAATFIALSAVFLLLGAATAFSQVAIPSGQAKPPTAPISRLEIPPGKVASCGYSPSLLYQMNQQANPRGRGDATTPSRRGKTPPATTSIFTPQGSFPPAQVVTCGKFRLYYEDSLAGTAAGFNDPTSNVGLNRRATLCAVLNYVENTFDINVNGTTDFIDLYIGQSWSSSTNPAPSTVGYLAIGGPFFNPASGYGSSAGYYPGNVLLHATLGTDPQLMQYDGVILVNFDQYFDPSPFPISYWDYYLNTTGNCRFDLYSVLLHEVTHALGFLSNVKEDSNFDATSGVPNNSFTKFDQLFLYYGSSPCTSGSLTKVVTGTSPSINPAVSSLSDELRSNRIWLRNSPMAQNHPIYSGMLDPGYKLEVGSLVSHMAGNLLSFTGMSQYAPGFQPNYVMGPSFGKGQRKREWTLAELRILLSMGYVLKAAFSASTSLNGIDPNGWLLLNNSPAYRTNCSQPMLAYNSPVNFMEILPADFPSLTNNNTPTGLTTTQLMINVASLSVADAQGDAIRVMPGTLFGIRGVSNNANNHAALSVNTSGSQIVYTPEPGFHGRAQFGFYLWDGHERGALRVVTIDVVPDGYTVAPGNQLVINSGLEDGTEVRQRGLSPNVEHSSLVDWAYEGIFAGHNLSGGHPFNYLTNFWNLGGSDIVQNQWYECDVGMGSNAQNGRYGDATADWNSSGYNNFNFPQPVTPSGNDRYHAFKGDKNYSTLINKVQGCNVYKFEADINFQKTGFTVGQNFTFQLQFVDNPSPSFHTQLYYTVPVNVTISTVAPILGST